MTEREITGLKLYFAQCLKEVAQHPETGEVENLSASALMDFMQGKRLPSPDALSKISRKAKPELAQCLWEAYAVLYRALYYDCIKNPEAHQPIVFNCRQNHAP